MDIWYKGTWGYDSLLVSLAEADWTRLQREPYHTSTDNARTREPNYKQRIVAERGYLNLELDGEDVARPPAQGSPSPTPFF